MIRADVEREMSLPFKKCSDLLEGAFTASNDVYTLGRRISERSLVNKLGEDLKQWQREYLENVEKSITLFKKNIKSTREMDEIFHDAHDCNYDSESDEIPIIITKDKRYKLKYPFFKCPIQTTKMRRHLFDTHKMSKKQ